MRYWVLIAALLLPSPAEAACTCECVNGVKQPLCTSTLDIPIPCIGICPLVPPAVPPVPSVQLPPLGTQSCRFEQVWTGTQYEFRNICR